MSDDKEKLLLNASEAAAFIGVDRKVFGELKSAGETPPPVRLRTRDYWLRDTLKQWLKDKEVNNENPNQ